MFVVCEIPLNPRDSRSYERVPASITDDRSATYRLHKVHGEIIRRLDNFMTSKLLAECVASTSIGDLTPRVKEIHSRPRV